MQRRRSFLASAATLSAFTMLPGMANAAETFEVTRSEAEWRKLLTANQYAVLRQSATERPFTSALLNEHRRGVFTCAGCQLPLFSSATK